MFPYSFSQRHVSALPRTIFRLISDQPEDGPWKGRNMSRETT